MGGIHWLQLGFADPGRLPNQLPARRHGLGGQETGAGVEVGRQAAGLRHGHVWLGNRPGPGLQHQQAAHSSPTQ